MGNTAKPGPGASAPDDATRDDATRARHLRITEASDWVTRFAPLVRPGGTVLDLACGGGRHARLFLDRGHPVVCVDKTVAPVADLAATPGTEVIELDLEAGRAPFAAPAVELPGPLAGRRFDAIVVSNYLHRPLLPALVAALAPGGVLIYETFARGNEAFTRPRNPDHLLKASELLDAVHGNLTVVAYEHGLIETGPLPGVKQRLCAVNDAPAAGRDDGEPDPRPLKPAPEGKEG